MRSYLVSSGIEKIISDKDFPLSERTGKWGAQDHVLFQRLMKDLKEEKQEESFYGGYCKEEREERNQV